jgi:hypothetical protein
MGDEYGFYFCCVLKITSATDYCHHFQNNIIIILMMTEKKNQLDDGNTVIKPNFFIIWESNAHL